MSPAVNEPVIYGPGLGEPVVYRAEPGTPDQFAVLLDSLAAMVDHEPDDTFANAGVRDSARHLARLLDACTERGEGIG